jgi:hypothetical protein
VSPAFEELRDSLRSVFFYSFVCVLGKRAIYGHGRCIWESATYKHRVLFAGESAIFGRRGLFTGEFYLRARYQRVGEISTNIVHDGQLVRL